MNIRWADKYIGREYGKEPGQYQCWELIQAIYQEQLGVALPAYEGVDLSDVQDLLRVAREFKRDAALAPWTQVKEPRNFDVVILSLRQGREFLPVHAGIFLEDRLLHVEKQSGVVWVRFDDKTIKGRVVAYCRHEKMLGEYN